MGKVKDGASALIMSPDKVLLFHRDNIPTIPSPDCWQIVGGGIEPGESPREAVLREVEEEVSVRLPHCQYVLTRRGSRGENVHVFVAFVDKTDEDKFKLGPGEGQGIGWFTLDEVAKLKLTTSTHLTYVELRPFIEEIMQTRQIDTSKIDHVIKIFDEKYANKT